MNYQHKNQEHTKLVLMIWTDSECNTVSFIYYLYMRDFSSIEVARKKVRVYKQDSISLNDFFTDYTSNASLHSTVHLDQRKELEAKNIFQPYEFSIRTIIHNYLKFDPEIIDVKEEHKLITVSVEGFEPFQMKKFVWNFYSSMLYHFKQQLNQRAITNASNNAVKRLYELEKEKLEILSPVIEEDDGEVLNTFCNKCDWTTDSELIYEKCPNCNSIDIEERIISKEWSDQIHERRIDQDY